MNDLMKFTDIVHVVPDPKITVLPDKEKYKLLDSAMAPANKGKGGLKITWDLSNAGRRINNRVYPVKGQKDGLETILSPFPKPILKFHDKDSEPLGRFSDAWWVDREKEAVRFFSNVQEFLEVKDAFDRDEPELIYEVMKKYNLLTDRKWPGLGSMRVESTIMDKDAIEKFLDGRYYTFSAGSGTDRHVCSVCASDWAKGDICEHRHGRIYDDDICVFITGLFKVSEGSVVNNPANDFSTVISMELSDSLENINHVQGHAFLTDTDTIQTTDSTFTFFTGTSTMEDDKTNVESQETTAVDLNDLSGDELGQLIFKGNEDYTSAFTDALKGDSHFEQTLLIQVHDSLHRSFDYEIRWGSVDNIPRDVYALHGRLHEISTEQNFRGSFRNGPLDKRDSEGKVSEEYVLPSLEEPKDNVADQTTGDIQAADEANAANEDDLSTQNAESSEVASQADPFTPEQLQVILSAVKDMLASETTQEASTKENADDAQEEGEVNTEDETKAPGLEESDESQSDSKVDTSELKEDYAKALETVKDLSDKLDRVLLEYAKLKEVELSAENSDSKLVFTWDEFVNIVDEAGPNTDATEQKAIESPSEHAPEDSDESLQDLNLGKYEQEVVSEYKKLLDQYGADAAERYYSSKSTYLPRGFHPKNLID